MQTTMSNLKTALSDLNALSDPAPQKASRFSGIKGSRTPTAHSVKMASASKIKPTPEQERVLECTDRRIKVKAFAGSGKTTLLVDWARVHDRERWLYIAFNRSVRDEAVSRFPNHVHCVTSHGLAFPQFGAPRKDKLDIGVYWNSVYAATDVKPPHPRVMRLYGMLLLGVVSGFVASADDGFLPCHIPEKDWRLFTSALGALPGVKATDPQILLRDAEQVWLAMLDPKNTKIGFTHDAYIKLMQLSVPSLPYDGILLDEGQDSNPALLDIVQRHQGGQVIVGDQHQSIYSFRGSVDAMNLAKVDREFALTGSFRFGHEVADFANALLVMKGESQRLRGLGAPSVVAQKAGVMQTGTALLSRTNAALFREAASRAVNNKKIYITGGVAAARFDLLRDLSDFLHKGKPEDPLLASFETYEQFKAAVIESEEHEWVGRCRLVEEFGKGLGSRLLAIEKNIVGNIAQAEYVFATAHKAKGLEFDHVILSDDFVGAHASKKEYNRMTSEKEIEDTNILYVAASRAKKSLVVQPEHYEFWRRVSPMIDPTIPDSVREPLRKQWSPEMMAYFDKSRLLHYAADKCLTKNGQPRHRM